MIWFYELAQTRRAAYLYQLDGRLFSLSMDSGGKSCFWMRSGGKITADPSYHLCADQREMGHEDVAMIVKTAERSVEEE